jgi:hypothetical protein
MISGLGISSSGIASAVRTASTARASMDSMTRQITTGQRVASVKDDSAAWAQAAALRAELPVWDQRGQSMREAQGGLDYVAMVVDNTTRALDRLAELALLARTSGVGSTARQAIAAEWAEVTEWTKVHDQIGDNPFFQSTAAASGWVVGGYDFASRDPWYGPGNFSIFPNGAGFDNWMELVDAGRPVALRGFDMANATSAMLDDAMTSIRSLQQVGRNWQREIASDHARADRLEREADAGGDRVRLQIGSLTDADLGKASTARAQAETRQQLALSTVRQALDAYGAYAGGLLGNVQRTQRGISA